MNGYRLSSQAEAQLDDIWLHIARESGSIDTAIRILQNITDRFWLLTKRPRIGRRREDLSPDLRSFNADNYVILYSIEKDGVVLIHCVFHGNQDIRPSFIIERKPARPYPTYHRLSFPVTVASIRDST
jgi:toxin ParE1/3/4